LFRGFFILSWNGCNSLDDIRNINKKAGNRLAGRGPVQQKPIAERLLVERFFF
jgi:hypothetical protein